MIEPSRRIILRPLILERRGQQPISFSEFDRLRFQTDYHRFRRLADQAAPQTVGACRIMVAGQSHPADIGSSLNARQRLALDAVAGLGAVEYVSGNPHQAAPFPSPPGPT